MVAQVSKHVVLGVLALVALVGCTDVPPQAADVPGSSADGPSAGAPSTPGPALPDPTARSSGKPDGIKIFLVALGDDGRNGERIGCGDSLVAVDAGVPATPAPLRAAVEALFAAPEFDRQRSGLVNLMARSTLAIDSVTIKDGTAVVALTGELEIRGVCDSPRIDGHLKATALQFPTVQAVSITVNGVPLDDLFAEK